MEEITRLVDAHLLWPIWSNSEEFEGEVPEIPEKGEYAWVLITNNHPKSIDNQLDELLTKLGSNTPKDVKENCTITINEEKGPVYIHNKAIIGPSSLFEGPCYIGPNATVRHGAYVRPYSWICSNAVVGHASEVKRSLLLPNAKAPHFNYVGDSVLGSNVNLGAGCKISNLRLDGKEVNVRMGEYKMSSGVRKFGALLGDSVEIGCNVVTNPGVIIGCGSSVSPNITVTGIYPENAKLR